jgi:hypothetical protein
MSNKVKQIDLLNRNSLIILGKKLQIPGYTNSFTKPYRNMEYLRGSIIDTIKNQKKMSRSRSNSTSSMQNSNAVPTAMKLRSKSLSSLSDMSGSVNTGSMDRYLLKNNKSCMFPPQKKIVAIGDIHGDLSVAIKSLKLAQVIDLSIPDNIIDITKVNWIGGDTFVVQLGDQIDRVRPSKLFNSLCTEEDEELYEDEGSDLKIIYLFERLNQQAQKCGGAVISILGNHELMNVDGDFRYVSPKEFREFGNKFNGKLEYNSPYPYGYKERKEVFQPGGALAKKLANTRYSIVQVGKWLFVHGGITSECSNKYSLNHINYYIKRWLLGDTSMNNMKHVHNLYHRDDDEHSPFWTRVYSDMDEWGQDALVEFNNTMNSINIWNSKNNDNKAYGIVMGHSPQFMYNKGINSSIGNRIWRVDVGASRAFGKVEGEDSKNRLAQVLVITNDGRDPNNDFHIIRERG